MERKIYNNLLKWKDDGAKKPLMVIGARQVGKTWVIEEFLRKEYPRHMTLNLYDRADVVSVFSEKINTQEKIDRLSLLLGEKLDFENTPIFFDEVQESEEIISALKFFAESEIPYKIICAGSLLGVKINRFNKPFPVGKVEMLTMYPMDMEEFLLAYGEEPLTAEIRSCFEQDRNMSDPLHEKCMKYFRMYLCSGGMPEAVGDLIKNNGDVLLFKATILTDIRNAYLSDMNKYVISAPESTKIEAIYNSIPSQLGNKSRKFQYSKVKKGARSRDFSSALDWLVSSGMIQKCNRVNNSAIPLKGYLDDGYFKIYMSDVGILCNILDIRLPAVMLDTEFFYKGMIIENYVACQLAAIGIPLYYWESANTAEVDFLIDTCDGIIPFEVKAGKNKVSASMEVYRKKFAPAYILKARSGNFGFVNGIRNIPLYAVFCLDQHRAR